MSRNIIGTFTRAEEYERGEAGPDWLNRFAKDLEDKEAKTAVEVARERDQAASIVTQISSIIGGDKPRYRSVEEAVAYYQEATGITEYSRRAAAAKVVAAGNIKTASADDNYGVVEFTEEDLSGEPDEIEVSEFEDEEEPYSPPSEIEMPEFKEVSEYPKIPSSEEIKSNLKPADIKNLLSALNSTIFRIDSANEAKAKGKDVSYELIKPEAKHVLGMYRLVNDGWVNKADYVDFLKDVRNVVGPAWEAVKAEIKARRAKKASEEDLKKKV